MAKSDKKMVSTSVVTSRKLGQVSDFGERLFWRIYFASDAYGALRADPWDVLLTCMPGVDGASLATVVGALDELDEVRLIERWVEASGEHAGPWLAIAGHDRHHTKEHLRKRGKRRSPVSPWATIEGGQLDPKGALRAENSGERPDTGDQVEVEGGEDEVLDLSKRQAYANWTAARDRHPELRARLDEVGADAFQQWLNADCPTGWVIDPNEIQPSCAVDIPLASAPRAPLAAVPPVDERDPSPSGQGEALPIRSPLSNPAERAFRVLHGGAVVTGLANDRAETPGNHDDSPVPA